MTSDNTPVLTYAIAYALDGTTAKQDLPGLTSAVVLHIADYSLTMVDRVPVD